MPDFTLSVGNTMFPVGTVVGAYINSQGNGYGELVQSQTMEVSSVTFTDLDPGRYIAQAQVNGAWRSTHFEVIESETLTDEMEEYVDQVAAGGVLIDESSRDSAFSTTELTATGEAIDGLAVTVPATETRPVLIVFTASVGKCSAALLGGVRLLEDGVEVPNGTLCALGDSWAPLYGAILLPAPDAQHGYTVEGYNVSAGTLDIVAGGDANVDMTLRAWRA